MKGKQMIESLKRGKIDKQYLLVSNEPILIDRALKEMIKALGVDESFDVDRFVLPEVATEDIVAKLFLTPLGSKSRMLIVKNLEDANVSDLDEFARAIKRQGFGNCLVMTYIRKKNGKNRKDFEKKLIAMFPDAQYVDFKPARNEIKQWIRSKVERDKIKLDNTMMDYLEEEFSNDITGLKNEFEKIENYLQEVGSMDKDNMRDLAKGLCNFDRYQVANAFLSGRPGALRMFEELQPYLPKDAMMVDSMMRVIIQRARGKGDTLQARKTKLQAILEQLITIDRKIKTSSIFTRLSMELFFLQNAGAFKNGVSYGR
jgi:DNA polymerase III delta subunit